MGKLKAQFLEVHFAGYNLSGRSRQIDINHEWEEVEVEAFLDTVANFIPGLSKAEVELQTLLDPDSGSSHEALKDPSARLSDVLSILFGDNAVPVIGDPGFFMTADQWRYATPGDVRAAMIAEVKLATKSDFAGSWGIALANATITDTTSFTGVDQSASSSAGGVGWLQVLGALASDTYVVKIQDAPPPGTVWSDLITFTLDASARDAERVAVSGAVDQHVRAIATRTGAAADSFRLSVGFERL